MKKFVLFCMLVMLMCSSTNINVVKPQAGVTPVTLIEDATFTENLDEGVYYVREVVREESGIRFTKTMSKAARVVSRNKVINAAYCGATEALRADVRLKIDEIKGRFAVMFGLAYPNSLFTSEGSSAVWFEENNEGLTLGISTYGESGRCVFTQAVSYLKDDELQLSFTVDVEGGITLYINEEMIVQQMDTDISTSGYFGFGQSDVSEVTITSAEVNGYAEQSPENTVALERFDEAFNANVWGQTEWKGVYNDQGVRRENGALIFDNVGRGLISTNLKYSNFEFAFDVNSLQREAEYTETGELLRPISSGLTVAFGGASAKADATANYSLRIEPKDGSNVLQSTATQIVVKKSGSVLARIDCPKAYHLWSSKVANGRAFNIKVTMRDMKLILQLKWADEPRFTTLLDFDLGETPLGVVQLVGLGTTRFNSGNLPQSVWTSVTCSVDNLSIANLDKEGLVKVLQYKSGEPKLPEDFVYNDTWNDEDLLS